jgi:hypothetical protein
MQVSVHAALGLHSAGALAAVLVGGALSVVEALGAALVVAALLVAVAGARVVTVACAVLTHVARGALLALTALAVVPALLTEAGDADLAILDAVVVGLALGVLDAGARAQQEGSEG